MDASTEQDPTSTSWDKKVDSDIRGAVEGIMSQRKKLEEDCKALEKEKLAWQKLEPKLDVSQLGGWVSLNVGGSLFVCSVEILRKIPDTYFSGLVSGRWGVLQHKDGSIFIDRDPTVFPLIMTYLRMYGTDFDFKLWHLTLSNQQRMLLKYEAEFFMLPGLLNSILPNGAILDTETWKSIHPSSEKRVLLFTSSDKNRTYFSAISDMRPKSNMLLVSKLQNGTIVGAFTSVAWDLSGSYQTDATAFLFYQKIGSALSKHAITAGQEIHATCQDLDYLWFGEGADLCFTMPEYSGGQISVIGKPHSFLTFPITLRPSQVVTDLEIWSLD